MRNFDPVRYEKVRVYLRAHPRAFGPEIAAAVGCSVAAAYRIKKDIAAKTGEVLESLPSKGARSHPDNSCELVTDNPCTLDDLIKACRVDLKMWRVARHVVNKWEVGTKDDDGNVTRTPLYQIKAWLERIPGQQEAEAIRETIEWIKSQRVVSSAPKKLKPKLASDDPHLIEFAIPDLHLGKLAWEQETGANYDSDLAEQVFMEAVENLWWKVSVFPVGRVLFVVGNDFFNVNSAANATASGTPQSEDNRAPKTFRRGYRLIVRAIEFLRQHVPEGVTIEVRVIVGNHDKERMFMAGEVVAAIYSGAKDVEVVNNPIKRQYVQWGTVLLGLTHGDAIKQDKLPLLMAGEAPAMWASTTHREWHMGHFHHKKETLYHTGSEHNAVRVRVLPSLTEADEWHYTNGYVGAKRAAEVYIWSKSKGYVGHLSWSPPEKPLKMAA